MQVMAATRPGHLKKVMDAIITLRPDESAQEVAELFEDEDLQQLYDARYRNASILKCASRGGLKGAGLPPALVDVILASGGLPRLSPHCLHPQVCVLEVLRSHLLGGASLHQFLPFSIGPANVGP